MLVDIRVRPSAAEKQASQARPRFSRCPMVFRRCGPRPTLPCALAALDAPPPPPSLPNGYRPEEGRLKQTVMRAGGIRRPRDRVCETIAGRGGLHWHLTSRDAGCTASVRISSLLQVALTTALADRRRSVVGPEQFDACWCCDGVGYIFASMGLAFSRGLVVLAGGNAREDALGQGVPSSSQNLVRLCSK